MVTTNGTKTVSNVPRAGYGRVIVEHSPVMQTDTPGEVVLPPDGQVRAKIVSVGPADERYPHGRCPLKVGDHVIYVPKHPSLLERGVEKPSGFRIGGDFYEAVFQVDVIAVERSE